MITGTVIYSAIGLVILPMVAAVVAVVYAERGEKK